jgi:hypothetical protein
MNLCESYLIKRGLSVEFARENGVEFDFAPQRDRIIERLGQACIPLWKFAREILWFHVYNLTGATTSWIARPLAPDTDSELKNVPKYVSAVGSSGPPFITKLAYESVNKASVPLIITEGPVKALVLAQSGFAAIGLGGVWGAHQILKDGKWALRTELFELGLKARKIAIGFDADWAIKPNVRDAGIRLFFLLAAAGAEVLQFTSWDEGQGKGIDDYIVSELREDPSQTAQAILSMLWKDAQPFIQTLAKTKVDIDAVESALEKVSLGRLHRDQLCRELYRPIGVGVDLLRAVGAQEQTQAGRNITFAEVSPWPEEVDGHGLVQDMMDIVHRHVIASDYSIYTAVLWSLLTYFVDCEAIDTLPFLTLVSPEMQCGKTRFQTVVEWFVYRPLSASNISSASVYRTVESYHPTLLLDEADTYTKENEELRGVLNSGHTREKAFVIRCNALTNEPERFSVWGPKSFALIGNLSGTLVSRSIVISMERKKRTERVKPLRATTPAERQEMRSKILRWFQDNQPKIEVLDAPTTEQVTDRDADNWLPLLQVAKLLGAEWLEFGLKTMIALYPKKGHAQENLSIIL